MVAMSLALERTYRMLASDRPAGRCCWPTALRAERAVPLLPLRCAVEGHVRTRDGPLFERACERSPAVVRNCPPAALLAVHGSASPEPHGYRFQEHSNRGVSTTGLFRADKRLYLVGRGCSALADGLMGRVDTVEEGDRCVVGRKPRMPLLAVAKSGPRAD